MIPVDSSLGLILDYEDVLEIDPQRLSDPAAFLRFSAALRVDQDFILNERWQQAPFLKSPLDTFNFIMHEMLPMVYDAAALEGMGGSFAIRVTGIADYVLISVNRRVVVLSGLPVDPLSGAPVIDLEIAPDVFLGYARGVLLGLAEDVLDDDDEHENRVISNAELMLHGLPAGGQNANAWRGLKIINGDGPGYMTRWAYTGTDFGSYAYLQYAEGISVTSQDGDTIFIPDAYYEEFDDYIKITQGKTTAAVYNYEGSQNNDLSAELRKYDNVICIGKAPSAPSAGNICSKNLSTCGAATGGPSACSADLGACGVAAGGAGACGANASGCGGNSNAAGACGQNLSSCGGKVSGIGGCAANTGACGADASGIGGCGANASTCAAKAGGIGGCGGNASTCAANVGLVSGCGANASACAAKASLPCGAYAVYCVVDAGFGLDVGGCLINIFPILPSC